MREVLKCGGSKVRGCGSPPSGTRARVKGEARTDTKAREWERGGARRRGDAEGGEGVEWGWTSWQMRTLPAPPAGSPVHSWSLSSSTMHSQSASFVAKS